jgi:pyridinium-3,5-biscarboxylic acid mononucleotide synthase
MDRKAGRECRRSRTTLSRQEGAGRRSVPERAWYNFAFGEIVDKQRARALLQSLQRGTLGVEEALRELQFPPFEDLGFAKVDHHRSLRRGFPEVVFGEGKSALQVLRIVRSLKARRSPVMVTRIPVGVARKVRAANPRAVYHAQARTLILTPPGWRSEGRPGIAVVAAGTSDVPVAEEAALTAELMGNRVERVYDVGVAGLHRLLAFRAILAGARVLIVVAGMEGALPSVVAGLVEAPVIAVPTSIGYGASFGGLTALLGMLNSCAGGVLTVNIDNGFGAGYSASLINRASQPVPGRRTKSQRKATQAIPKY